MSTEKKVIFITGASTGFGRLAAERFAKDGWNVVATMRTPEKETELQKQGIFVVALDVTKPETIDAAVQAAVQKFGTIDVLLNNAGVGNFGPFTEEPNTLAAVRDSFEVNFFGAIRTTQAVLPVFRKNKKGTIIYCSSVVALHTNPLCSAYASSKAALNSYAECAAYELIPFGIQTKILMPGAYKTEIMSKVKLVVPTNPELAAEYKESLDGFTNSMAALKLPTPERVIEDTVRAANDQDPKNIFWKSHEPECPYGQLVALREQKGASAQFSAIVDMTSGKKQ